MGYDSNVAMSFDNSRRIECLRPKSTTTTFLPVFGEEYAVKVLLFPLDY